MTEGTGRQANESARSIRQAKATLGGETVEARILLSATWIHGTSPGDVIVGTEHGDLIEALAGNDAVDGGNGNELDTGGIEFVIETDRDYELADRDYLARNLLIDQDPDAVRREQPDLVFASGGDEVSLRPRLAGETDAASNRDATWTQICGTPLDLDSVDSGVLRVRLPEVFVAEELVLEVEWIRGGERVVQEITVHVQPVGTIDRSLSIDRAWLPATEATRSEANDEGGRGIGRLWGAMLAFLGAQSGRKQH